jgi:hypothetical protein
MPAIVLECCAGRLGRVLGALLACFAFAVLALSPPHLILALNGLALSAAAGVSTAYLPIAGQALRRRVPTQGDVLGAGIFFAGLSDMALRLESIIARDLGRPAVLNSHAAAVSILLGVMALVAFLWAPYAQEGRVPREKWGRAGLLVAAGVAIAFAAGMAQHAIAPAPLMRLE